MSLKMGYSFEDPGQNWDNVGPLFKITQFGKTPCQALGPMKSYLWLARNRNGSFIAPCIISKHTVVLMLRSFPLFPADQG